MNLDKILGLLESKEHKISALSKAEANASDVMAAMKRVNDKEIQQVRKQANEESRFKVEAMTKLESAASGNEGQEKAIAMLRDANEAGVFDDVEFELVWTLLQSTAKAAD